MHKLLLFFSNLYIFLYVNIYNFLNIYRKKTNKILIVKVGNLGDLVTNFQAFDYIKQKYSNYKLDILTSTGINSKVGGKNVLDIINIFNEIYEFNLPIKLNLLFKILINLNKNRYYKIYYFYPESASTLYIYKWLFFLSLLGSRKIVKFRIFKLNLFNRLTNKYNFTIINEYDRALKLLDFEYVNFLPFKFEIIPTPEIFNFINNIDNYVLISPYAKAKTNIWSPNKVAQLINKFNSIGLKVILVGNTTSNEFNFGCNYINFINKTNLSDLIYLIENAKYFVTMETGTAHLASFLNTKTVVISPSNYVKGIWQSKSSNVFYLRKDISCSPCLHKTCKFGDNRCINSFDVNDVLNVLLLKYI